MGIPLAGGPAAARWIAEENSASRNTRAARQDHSTAGPEGSRRAIRSFKSRSASPSSDHDPFRFCAEGMEAQRRTGLEEENRELLRISTRHPHSPRTWFHLPVQSEPGAR